MARIIPVRYRREDIGRYRKDIDRRLKSCRLANSVKLIVNLFHGDYLITKHIIVLYHTDISNIADTDYLVTK